MGRAGRWMGAGVAALAVTGAVIVAGAGAVAADATGFDAVFRIDTEAATVDVELRIDVRPGRALTLEVPTGAAASATASADGDALAASLEPVDDFATEVTVAIPSDVDEVVVRYAIPSGPARTRTIARVNPAHVTFLLWIDEGLGNGSVRVELPRGFRGASYDGPLTLRSDGPEGQVWQDDRLAAASLWSEFIARNEAGLARSEVDIGNGRSVRIAGWADDAEWIAFAEETVSWAVPLLEDLIGQPWPESDLEVIETTEPITFGYAGWYSVWQSEILVWDELSVETMVHELAHAWFNSVRLEDKWMVEGWAEDYAARAITLHTGEPVEPSLPTPGRPGTSELTGWTHGGIDDVTEANSYATSWFVLHTIREEIGDLAMADVLAALLGGRRAYHVPGDPAVRPANTTARFFDVIEIVGGSTLADPILRTYVFGPGWDARLDLRREARAEYEVLVATGFAPPSFVRDHLEKWKFELALPAIRSAQEVADRLVALRERAGDLGTDLPAELVAAYEGADVGLQEAFRLVEEAEVFYTDLVNLEAPERRAAARRFAAGAAVELPAVDDESLPTAVAAGTGLAILLAVGFIALQVRALRQRRSRPLF